MLLSLCVWKQSVPDYYVLPTDVSQESPNIMWLKFSHVTDCYCHLSKLVQISLEMEPFTRSHVSNELMKLPVSFSAGLSPVPSLPSHKPFFRIPSCVCSILHSIVSLLELESMTLIHSDIQNSEIVVATPVRDIL